MFASIQSASASTLGASSRPSGVRLYSTCAALIAQSDAAAAKGALFDDSRQLSRLIGRPTTPLEAAIAAALES